MDVHDHISRYNHRMTQEAAELLKKNSFATRLGTRRRVGQTYNGVPHPCAFQDAGF
jgi:hypothetical protein